MKFLEFDDTRDFPYYNHNPRISKVGWFLLWLLIPISFIIYSVFGLFSEFLGSVLFCFSLLIPVLYFSNWDYSLIFYKPTRNEIILGILMFFGYVVYAFVFGSILDYYSLSGSLSQDYMNVNFESIVSLIFSMMGEELVKFIPLMFFMRVIFKYTSNRRLAIVVSSILVLIGFGLLHFDPPYSTIVSVLVLQGFGSIFEIYAYLKTKNLFVPFISHLLTDAVFFILILFGFS